MSKLGKFGGVFLLVTVAGLSGSALLFAPSFQIREISVTGGPETLRVEADTVIRRFLDEHGQFAGAWRLFLVRGDDLAKAMTDALPAVSQARVRRRLPGRIEVEIQEKVTVAFLDISGGFFALDEAGRAIATASAEDVRYSTLPVIRETLATVPVRIGDRVLRPEVMDLLRDIVVLLPDRLATTVQELTIPSLGTQEVRARTDRGWTVIFDGTRRLPDQLDALDKILTETLKPEELERLDYVDLRAPGKVFYRIRSGPVRR